MNKKCWLLVEDRASDALVPGKQNMLRLTQHSPNFPVTSPGSLDQKQF